MKVNLHFKRLFAVLMMSALLAAFIPPAPARADDATWWGAYYDNRSLAGTPRWIRYDPEIDFNWGSGVPDGYLPADNFSVRWMRTVYLQTARYRFVVTADDGVRLYLDGKLLIDQWRDQAAATYATEQDVQAGNHSLRLEYYENAGLAQVHLQWTRLDDPGQPTTSWRGDYYDNRHLAGAPRWSRYDPEIDFNWGTGVPDGYLPADNFSVRWMRTVYLQTARYRFVVTADDGVRLYLDGKLLIDQWRDQAAATYASEQDVQAGNHSLRLEYYENAGVAQVHLQWVRLDNPGQPSGTWRGEYYNNPWLSGSPSVVRDDASVAFDWGTGSPDSRVAVDNFSVRWTRTVYFNSGRYRFTTTTDDGVRLFIDNQIVIDRWYDMARSAYSAEVNLSGGLHVLRMEYYDRLLLATAQLSWASVTTPSSGNIVTCVRPSNSWIKVYRKQGTEWLDVNPRGWGALNASGYLKLDGMVVDFSTYGYTGHPYRVELWADGQLIRSVGNTDRGDSEFRVYAGQDNPTPWGCPAG